MMKSCTVTGCKNVYQAKGFCGTHYYRLRKYGGPLLAIRPGAPSKHAMSHTKEYHAWQGIILRCHNPKHPRYKDYGGRGIVVCNDWLRFENFIKDVGLAPSKKHSLDRINNARGYEPSNVKWSTVIEQNNNKRTNVIVSIAGKRMTLAEWSRALGLSAYKIKRLGTVV